MGKAEEHDIGDERPGAAGETPGDEDGHGMRGIDAEPDGDDEESLRRRDEWLTKKHDEIANDEADRDVFQPSLPGGVLAAA